MPDTDAEAHKQLDYARWQNRAGRSLNHFNVMGGRVKVGPYEGELEDEGLMKRLYFGSLDTAIKQIVNRLNSGGPT